MWAATPLGNHSLPAFLPNVLHLMILLISMLYDAVLSAMCCRQSLETIDPGCRMDPKILRDEGEILSHLVAKRAGEPLLFTC